MKIYKQNMDSLNCVRKSITKLNFNLLFFSGNLLCLFVFNHKSVDLKPSFANILKCLSVYDTALLVRKQRVYIQRGFLTLVYWYTRVQGVSEFLLLSVLQYYDLGF